MENLKIKTIPILALLVFLISCSSNTSSDNSASDTKPISSPTSPSTNSSASNNLPPENPRSSLADKDPYEVMHVAFEGSPAISKIKPMVEAIMERYNMPKTNDNILKVGNMLVSMRQSSTVGLTEMELLKHIYVHGSDQVTLAQQAGISATLIETSK